MIDWIHLENFVLQTINLNSLKYKSKNALDLLYYNLANKYVKNFVCNNTEFNSLNQNQKNKIWFKIQNNIFQLINSKKGILNCY